MPKGIDNITLPVYKELMKKIEEIKDKGLPIYEMDFTYPVSEELLTLISSGKYILKDSIGNYSPIFYPVVLDNDNQVYCGIDLDITGVNQGVAFLYFETVNINVEAEDTLDDVIVGNTIDKVIANPTLAGTESALTGLQVGDTKYKVGGKRTYLISLQRSGIWADLFNCDDGTNRPMGRTGLDCTVTFMISGNDVNVGQICGGVESSFKEDDFCDFFNSTKFDAFLTAVLGTTQFTAAASGGDCDYSGNYINARFVHKSASFMIYGTLFTIQKSTGIITSLGQNMSQTCPIGYCAIKKL